MSLKNIFWVLIPIFIIMGSFWIGFKAAESERPIYPIQISTESRIEPALAKWVYDKSSKISMETSRKITREALKTEHPLLILSLISVESEFDPSATSSKGAIGLTQVMWIHHSKCLVESKILKEKRDLYDIQVSINAGNLILGKYLSETKDVNLALERYLGGKDGFYTKRILSNLANLYILTRENKKKEGV